MYLITEAKPLSDQWECDAAIIPLCMVDDWRTYKFSNEKYYEIWKLLPQSGALVLIKEWDEDFPE